MACSESPIWITVAESDLIKRGVGQGQTRGIPTFQGKGEEPEKESEQEQTIRKGSQRTRNLQAESDSADSQGLGEMMWSQGPSLNREMKIYCIGDLRIPPHCPVTRTDGGWTDGYNHKTLEMANEII